MKLIPTWRLLLSALLIAGGSVLAVAGEPIPEPEAPAIAAASDEGEQAIAGFKRPAGYGVQLFAAEPMMANPAAFYVDLTGRVFVCETFRQQHGVEDNRSHTPWLDDDLAAQSVDDRRAYFQKHLKDKYLDYAKQDDRIRLLIDENQDGVADTSTVFADHFNDPVAGTGASVLSYRGLTYYTCIPDLWLLQDKNGDGRADERRSLYTGFGVRVAFRGHDMHGLIIGPDGRLYFSIGDRGYNVQARDKRLMNPESGAIFRCELDGSHLEEYARGLRNPQEMAFDDHGNLFTCDNNSDSGDKARWAYLVEGGDSGWRMHYQYLKDRGPFNREQLWHPYYPEQAAYIVPPIANVSDGPAGLAYYPGVGLGDDQKGRFFLCDFRGQASNSGIRSFRSEPYGAFFKLVDEEQPIWSILGTDVQFGPDGGLYISDWVHGWNGLGKGRIYKFRDLEQAKTPLVAEVQELLAGSFDDIEPNRLVQLLGHADQRVRQEAQFALVRMGQVERLQQTAKMSGELQPRLQAIWGLWQIGRQPDGRSQAAPVLIELLQDSDEEVRAQAAKVAGDLRLEQAVEPLIGALADESLRVRYFAAQAIGKLSAKKAAPAVLAMLVENADVDPIVRHGGVMALTGIADQEKLLAAASHPHRSARLGALLALRRLGSPDIARFLQDPDPLLVLEAARAIHDAPIPGALAALAALRRADPSAPLLERILNANYRLGQAENAAAIARWAGEDPLTSKQRLEALAMLDAWEKPASRDRVLGQWNPLEARSPEAAAVAIRSALPKLMNAPDDVRLSALKTAAKLGVSDVAPMLSTLFTDASQSGESRRDALLALSALKSPRLAEFIPQGLGDANALVRAAAREALLRQSPGEGVKELAAAVQADTQVERQQALALLGSLPQNAQAGAALTQAMRDLLADQIAADTRLDVLEAARHSKAPAALELVAKYESTFSPDNPLSPYLDALHGGDRELGEQIFLERREVSCVRCHKIGEQGSEVGPELTKIGVDKKREYLLEAIVAPNRSIAKDFASVQVITDEGKAYTGIIKVDDDKELRLMLADGQQVSIPQESIEARRAAASAMPDDLIKQLSPHDLRNLVEFLSSLK
ncbi:PVC-type heme-binding CxxCH protein [Lignipirellula cremea]|uniref:Quinoprotein glucose dehydrogenase B n=1 Tax=Lignipirellula cremea TaxID=2528010 RepID=A0A518DS78_9BACT|nr:PVC-type heme-binding CxxCH protein [Lignipirellula cremea]QDU94691.1 Quinoprotein glucose dehydrogenase B precursor [Lignipirellula cremea]